MGFLSKLKEIPGVVTAIEGRNESGREKKLGPVKQVFIDTGKDMENRIAEQLREGIRSVMESRPVIIDEEKEARKRAKKEERKRKVKVAAGVAGKAIERTAYALIGMGKGEISRRRQNKNGVISENTTIVVKSYDDDNG